MFYDSYRMYVFSLSISLFRGEKTKKRAGIRSREKSITLRLVEGGCDGGASDVRGREAREREGGICAMGEGKARNGGLGRNSKPNTVLIDPIGVRDRP